MPAASKTSALAGATTLPAPSAILVWVGAGVLTVEMVVVLEGTRLRLGTNDALDVVRLGAVGLDVVVPMSTDVVFCSTAIELLVVSSSAVVVVVGGSEVLVLVLLTDVVVSGGGVCDTRPPGTLYSAAQASRSISSGQHHVSPSWSSVQ